MRNNISKENCVSNIFIHHQSNFDLVTMTLKRTRILSDSSWKHLNKINLNLNSVIEVFERATQFYLEFLKFILKMAISLSLSELFVI